VQHVDTGHIERPEHVIVLADEAREPLSVPRMRFNVDAHFGDRGPRGPEECDWYVRQDAMPVTAATVMSITTSGYEGAAGQLPSVLALGCVPS
jgi:hypothetical protein